MRRIFPLVTLLVLLSLCSCQSKKKAANEKTDGEHFPTEVVSFTPYKANPVFTGTGTDTWDKNIRERGYILFEDSLYKMWYTGYSGKDADPKYLGYATSKDGIKWNRYSGNPIFNKKWTEDMYIIKDNGKYYMYAEGKNDIAHFLTSGNGINWNEEGDLEIRKVNGEPIAGPYGTPSVWIEDGKWYLFYERNDEAIWLAQSIDHRIWTNVQDTPIIEKGPQKYDAGAVAADQVIKFKGKYYLYYHASSQSMATSVAWTSNVAMSEDMVHWIKYAKNPIVEGDHSSPIVVNNGDGYRLYTMHPEVWLYLPDKDSKQ